MAEAFGYSSRGRGRGTRGIYGGRGRCRGQFGGEHRRTNQFQIEILEDGFRFVFPSPRDMHSDPTLMKAFKNQLKCLGGYSEDEEKAFCNDNSALHFLNTKYLPDSISKEKTVNLDLAIAEEKAKPYTGSPMQTLHNYFSWILSNEKKFFEEIKNESANNGIFVFTKSVISTIMNFPFQFTVDYAFHAVRFDKLIYLMMDRRASKTNQVENERISNWAHKFEHHLVVGEDKEAGIVSNSDFRCVLSSKIGSHKLIYSTAVDCFNPDLYDEDMDHLTACVQLKCTYETENSREKNNLKRHKMRTWCNSLILTGTPHVLVGFRDKDGVVDLLKLYSPEDLISEGKEYWDIEASFTFVEKLLSFVKERTASKPGTYFYFEKPACQNYVLSSEMPVDEFLPQWFSDEVQLMGADTAE